MFFCTQKLMKSVFISVLSSFCLQKAVSSVIWHHYASVCAFVAGIHVLDEKHSAFLLVYNSGNAQESPETCRNPTRRPGTTYKLDINRPERQTQNLKCE